MKDTWILETDVVGSLIKSPPPPCTVIVLIWESAKSRIMAILLPLTFAITNLLSFSLQYSSASDTLTQSHPLLDDEKSTLVSKDGTFELGFFTPGSSTNRYLGIWYKNIPDRTVVWVANREKLLKNDTNSNTTSSLSITPEGQLQLVLRTQNDTAIIWSANQTSKGSDSVSNPSVVAQLLDSGNLVLRNQEDENNPDKYRWESFDYPSDTFLPGMKIGWDLKRGIERRLRAWKSWDDPSYGELSWGMVLGVTPELVMWKGEQEYYRSGPWNGVIFSGKTTPIFDLHFVSTQDEV